MTAAKTKRKAKEFGLSDAIPEAVMAMQRKAAADAWQARSNAAAEAIKFPAAPYRIIGDSEAGRWFIEAAEIKRSATPTGFDDQLSLWRYYMLSGMLTIEMDPRVQREIHERRIAAMAADTPTAKLEWNRIGRKKRGWMTYAKAFRWLQDWLEPVRDESTYFTAEGHQTRQAA